MPRDRRMRLAQQSPRSNLRDVFANDSDTFSIPPDRFTLRISRSCKSSRSSRQFQCVSRSRIERHRRSCGENARSRPLSRSGRYIPTNIPATRRHSPSVATINCGGAAVSRRERLARGCPAVNNISRKRRLGATRNRRSRPINRREQATRFVTRRQVACRDNLRTDVSGILYHRPFHIAHLGVLREEKKGCAR